MINLAWFLTRQQKRCIFLTYSYKILKEVFLTNNKRSDLRVRLERESTVDSRVYH